MYSTATSLLVRSLQLDGREKVTSYTISAADKNHLFVSTYSGLVLKWDWTTGEEIKRWKSSTKLLFISTYLQDQIDTTSSHLLMINEASNQNRRVSRATFLESSDGIVDGKVLLEQRHLASWSEVLDGGRCLVLYAENKLLLGQLARRPQDAPPTYVWRELNVPRSITSIDVRSHTLSSSTKKKRLAMDVVVGCQDGLIFIYDDILFRLTSKAKSPEEDTVVSRRFHWHRNAVLTVKWSLDGNYVISGGHETVMVIWQLDTGQQQFLPHLSASVEHLTVSKTGSSYALHLADNSVMVLSTTELQPTAYVSGLVLRHRRLTGKNAKRIPAILQHKESTMLALAVPADNSTTSRACAKATLLQIYDVQRQQQAHRQALVRNNITALNVAPSGKPVQEPDVTHLKMSYDEKWLATVDEWTPPQHDVEPLYPANDDPLLVAKEVFLKFWTKNESTGSWELVTKIESPHSMERTAANPILDLQANPLRSEFSTISSNGSINIWTPKSRHRNGLPVKDRSGAQLYTWTCTHAVEIPLALQNPISSTGALAYSPDGSVLAASSNRTPFIHFINPRTGKVQHTQHGSRPGRFFHLTFLNHHLITISRDLRVYNTVNSELLYALALQSCVSDVYLVANQLDQTFAVACNLPALASKEEGARAKAKSHIMVFGLKSAGPVFRTIVDGTVEILLPLPRENGYLIVNDEAEVVFLRRAGGGAAKEKDMEMTLVEEPVGTNALEDIFRRRGIELPNGDAAPAAKAIMNGYVPEEEKDEKGQQIALTHKAQSSLLDVFSRSTNLPVQELFEQVVAVLKHGS